MDNTFTVRGLTFDFQVKPDDCMGAPWDEHDGHGPVREIRGDATHKRPGERVLSTDRGIFTWLYDWQGAMALAKRDGWGLAPEHLVALAKKLGREPTPGEIRAAAVQRDFDYCRRYASGDWSWSFVEVRLLDVNMEPTGERETLGGIESDAYDYHDETARELAAEIAARIPNRAKVFETRHAMRATQPASVTRWRIRR